MKSPRGSSRREPSLRTVGGTLVFLPVGAQLIGVAGGVGASIALERAALDLRWRGVRVSTAAARVGDAMLGAGTLSILVAAPLYVGGVRDGTTDRALPFAAFGWVLTFAAVFPYAIQAGITSSAYDRVPPTPDEHATFTVAPAFDPVARTIGVTGTF